MMDKFLEERREKARSDNGWLGLMLFLSLVMLAADLAVDLMLPTDKLWMNAIRTVLVLVSSYPFFCFGYSVVMRQHGANVAKYAETGVDYVDYRLRYSPSMRMRQSAIAGAVLAVLAIITSYSAIYTFVGGVVVASLIGIAAYCRYTPDEKVLRDYDVPDPRDVMDDLDRADRELDKAARAEIREEEIARRKSKILGTGDGDGDLDSDDGAGDSAGAEDGEPRRLTFKEYNESMEGKSWSQRLK